MLSVSATLLCQLMPALWHTREVSSVGAETCSRDPRPCGTKQCASPRRGTSNGTRRRGGISLREHSDVVTLSFTYQISACPWLMTILCWE